MYQKDKKDRERVDSVLKTFESTLGGIFDSVTSTNNKFYEMVTKIETEHFKQLEKTSDKQMVFYATQMDKIIDVFDKKPVITEQILDRITPIDTTEKNSIEKEEELGNPLAEFDPAMLKNVKNIQFEGEEQIYPLGNE
jgi:hypothetical protein